MDRQQIATKLVMDALGLQVRMQNFDDRLVLQKAVYLAQEAGVNLGYQFHWYLRGPYSPVLTRDGFAIVSELDGEDESKAWKLDDRSMERLRRLAGAFVCADTRRMSRRLELLASVHFLVARGQVPKQDASAVAERLRRFGKRYDKEDVRKAIEALTKHGALEAPAEARS